jgi:hypothetical protein
VTPDDDNLGQYDNYEGGDDDDGDNSINSIHNDSPKLIKKAPLKRIEVDSTKLLPSLKLAFKEKKNRRGNDHNNGDTNVVRRLGRRNGVG